MTKFEKETFITLAYMVDNELKNKKVMVFDKELEQEKINELRKALKNITFLIEDLAD